ncbi:putative membrane protein YgcG [Leifsonia sp. AK011]|uniref:DUF2207 domain-containing protein n=1 Tax=Leifsonia sp. AK011 TaxID=2723075 RepID=UPI0015CBF589|nr:DUF2207 domain-containing protein [Leifsonia sp. AK011]NYF10426.1 putative membrane protein YgcG [Leifsonia sp. AK011]
MKLVRVAALAAILLLGSAAAPALAAESTGSQATPASVGGTPTDVNDFSFESFDAEYYLDTNSEGRATLRVVETIVAIFPDFDQNRGIIRALPLTYGDVRLEPSVVSITDENGANVPYERDDYGDFAELALGTDDYVQGRTTYVIEYTMRDVIRHFEDSGGDEFYWDINGDGWAQSFGTVSATVHLSASLEGGLTGDASCFLGYYGEVGQCELEREGSTFSASLGPVLPYNTLTVAIGFDGGTVVQPTPPTESWIVQVVPKVLLALSGFWLLLAFVLRSLLWRDAKGRGTIIAQYSPPESSDLLLDAELLRRQESGFPALLIDFAVRGMIRIIDTEPGGSSNDQFELELVTGEGASARERRVLVALFGTKLTPGKRVNPGKLSAGEGSAIYAMRSSTATFADSEGLRARPVTTVPTWIRRGAGLTWIAFAPVWAWAAWFGALGVEVVLPAIVASVLALVTSMVLILPPRLTEAGAEARDYLEGLRLYLTVAEEERMRMLQSPEGALRVDVADHDAIVKLNERLLPYAVLWGVEDRWVEELRAEWSSGGPSWLDGTSLTPQLMSNFSSASVSTIRPIVTSSSSGSSWSSSGGSSFSSGSSGGGFSGGGGGGGGGGGR